MWVYLYARTYLIQCILPKKNVYSNSRICLWICVRVCLCVMNKGDSEDAAVDCGSQHVQELLHHCGHVPPSPLLRFCWCCSLWNCQIRREHQSVRIRSSVYWPIGPILHYAACSRWWALQAVCSRYSKAHLYRIVWFCLSPLIAGMPTSPRRARLSLYSSVLSQEKIGIKSCMTAW